MSAPADEPAIITLYVRAPGELALSIPRGLEPEVTQALRAHEDDVGRVLHLLQESADVLQNVVLILDGVANVATLIKILLDSRVPAAPSGRRVRFRQRRSSTTLDVDGYDAGDVTKIARAIGDELEGRDS